MGRSRRDDLGLSPAIHRHKSEIIAAGPPGRGRTWQAPSADHAHGDDLGLSPAIHRHKSEIIAAGPRGHPAARPPGRRAAGRAAGGGRRAAG